MCVNKMKKKIEFFVSLLKNLKEKTKKGWNKQRLKKPISIFCIPRPSSVSLFESFDRDRKAHSLLKGTTEQQLDQNWNVE